MQQAADRALTGPELAGDLLPRVILEDAEQQGAALGVGQLLDCCDRGPQRLASRGHVGWLRHAVDLIVELERGRWLATQSVDRGVVGHAVQPAPDVHLVVAAAQRGAGLQQRLLDRVLGVVGAHDPRALASQPRAMAANQLLERGVVALPVGVEEAGVALQTRGHGALNDAGQGRSALRDQDVDPGPRPHVVDEAAVGAGEWCARNQIGGAARRLHAVQDPVDPRRARSSSTSCRSTRPGSARCCCGSTTSVRLAAS